MNKVLWGILGVLLVLNTLVWGFLYSQGNSGELSVTLLDVGQGDAIYIETPGGRQILIDGGPDTSVLRELSRVMPFWDRSLDLVILTHADKDHVAGLPEVLKRFAVAHTLSTQYEADTSFDRAWRAGVRAEESVHIEAKRGQVLILEEGITLTVLYPDFSASGRGINDTSVVFRLDYGETSFLFTGDMEERVEEYLLSLDAASGILDVDVLKVAHHGSKSSSSLAFLGAVTPAYALISAGKDNSFGHPHAEVLDNLALFTEDILCTCVLGKMTLTSDGEVIRKH